MTDYKQNKETASSPENRTGRYTEIKSGKASDDKNIKL